MFIDKAKIYIKAGNGGDGAVTFHREKYVANGGPDGGDGGKGGDIIFRVDNNMSTLEKFRFKRKFVAENGENGGTKACTGKSGNDLVISLPKGTLVKEAETGRILADMSADEEVIIAKGGNGGAGNRHFKTSTRQIPRFAKPGKQGDEFELFLELKLLADVGLVGFPNVGKSTLISVVSAAKPNIANYHFTTLTPVLGVVNIGGDKSFVMADIPGLIEGASEGVGLGHDFLRHIERCRLIVHVLDVSGVEGRDPKDDFEKINKELANFSEELSERPQIVVGNKSDMADEEQIKELKNYVESKGYKFFNISAVTKSGVDELLKEIIEQLSKLPPVKAYETQPYTDEERLMKNAKKGEFHITVESNVYYVEAEFLDEILLSVDTDDYESLMYFQRVLQDKGVISALEQKGVQEGDTVCIGDFSFEFVK